jgi:hypothetical protein
MSLETKRIWTGSVTAGTLTIDASYGFVEISIVMTSGTGTVECDGATSNGIASTPIPLTVGQSINISTGANLILNYAKIVTTGTVLILGR